MASNDIAGKVGLIFKFVDHEPTPYGASPHEVVAAQQSLRPQPAYVWTGRRLTPAIEQVVMARQLHQTCSCPEERGQFADAMTWPVRWVLPGGELRIVQAIAHGLVEAGAFERLPLVPLKDDDWPARERLWHAFRVKLSFEPSWFTDGALEQAAALARAEAEKLPLGPPDEIIANYRPVAQPAARLQQILWAIGETIERIRYLRLKNELEVGEHRPEIEADERLLAGRLAQLGFSPALEQTLSAVDEQVRKAQTGLDLKQCMDLLRTVLEKFAERAAEEVAVAAGCPLPPSAGPRKFSESNQQLLKHGILTDAESQVTQKLANYLGQAGVHALSSQREQVNVCRVTVIEWTLLIAGRLQEKLR